MEEQEQKLSKYNSGVAIQIRLDSLWKDANSHSREGKYSKWDCDLDAIWRELARDISDKEWDTTQIAFDVFTAEITKVGNIADEEPAGFKKPDDNFWKKRNEHYKILMKKELFLKRLENKLGKGTATADEDDLDLE